MVDYLQVKRSNHIFVVVYRAQSDVAAIAVDVRNISFPVDMGKKLGMDSV